VNTYERNRACPKCGHRDWDDVWRDDWPTSYGVISGPVTEAIRRACQNCGYVEHVKPLDYNKGEK
jgi:ribosomal protein S27AE